jgi:hypothetical protein
LILDVSLGIGGLGSSPGLSIKLPQDACLRK